MNTAKLIKSHQLLKSQFTDKDIARFWKHVPNRPEVGCWHWTANIGVWGYGQMWILGKTIRATRVAMAIHCGEVPAGMVVAHHCDVRSCVRPDHLFICTTKDNMADAAAKGRMAGRFGERAPVFKLTSDIAREIRERYSNGESQKSIAQRFGIDPSSVSRVVRRRTWPHI